MSTIPSHVMSPTEYIITREQLDLTLDIQEFVRALLNRVFVADFGHMLLVGSSSLLVSSTLGYVGAVRECRLLLFLVRHGISLGIFMISYFLSVLCTHTNTMGPGACLSYSSPSLHAPAVQLLILAWTAESG